MDIGAPGPARNESKVNECYPKAQPCMSEEPTEAGSIIGDLFRTALALRICISDYLARSALV